MKVFFDTNVYVAEALLGPTAERMVSATLAAAWRIFVSEHVLSEVASVLTDQLGFSPRLAVLTRIRVARRSTLVKESSTRHVVPHDPNDSAILRAALAANADYLVTNDRHLLALDPYHGLRILSLTDYFQLLQTQGLIP